MRPAEPISDSLFVLLLSYLFLIDRFGMELQHVNVKLFAAGEPALDLEQLIRVFHAWTATQALPEMLVDVADYRHVPAGPGVVLVGLEADYAWDQAQDRDGLLYNRKAFVGGSNEDRFQQALHAAATVGLKLEHEVGPELKLSCHELQLLINDRALAPNTPETAAVCLPQLQQFFAKTLGHGDFSLTVEPDRRRRFGVHLRSSQPFNLTKF
jgi:hypothetical protein